MANLKYLDYFYDYYYKVDQDNKFSVVGLYDEFIKFEDILVVWSSLSWIKRVKTHIE